MDKTSQSACLWEKMCVKDQNFVDDDSTQQSRCLIAAHLIDWFNQLQLINFKIGFLPFQTAFRTYIITVI